MYRATTLSYRSGRIIGGQLVNEERDLGVRQSNLELCWYPPSKRENNVLPRHEVSVMLFSQLGALCSLWFRMSPPRMYGGSTYGGYIFWSLSKCPVQLLRTSVALYATAASGQSNSSALVGKSWSDCSTRGSENGLPTVYYALGTNAS